MTTINIKYLYSKNSVNEPGFRDFLDNMKKLYPFPTYVLNLEFYEVENAEDIENLEILKNPKIFTTKISDGGNKRYIIFNDEKLSQDILEYKLDPGSENMKLNYGFYDFNTEDILSKINNKSGPKELLSKDALGSLHHESISKYITNLTNINKADVLLRLDNFERDIKNKIIYTKKIDTLMEYITLCRDSLNYKSLTNDELIKVTNKIRNPNSFIDEVFRK